MESRTYKASVIIPNYNRRDYLERLLPSIADQTQDDYEVIIIDDCSPEREAVDYAKAFIKNHKNMRLIENQENLGFVKTCNKGFRLASGDYICQLTNDTAVTRDFVEKNVRIMASDSSIGVLSCIIVDDEENIWSSGGSLDMGLEMSVRDDFEGIRSVDFVPGTACFYRKEVFEKAGFLNESFVMYHEDVEFCLRVKHKTDYRVCMFSEKLVTHYVKSRALVSGKVCYYMYRNLTLVRKQYIFESLPRLFYSYLKVITNLVRTSLRKRDLSYVLLAPYIIKGAFHGIIGKTG